MFERIRVIAAVATLLAGVGSASIAKADRYDRHVLLVNNSHATITEFQASNRDDDFWSDDVLGDYVVRPGQYVRLDLDDGSGYCKFDFRTVLDDGSAIVRHSVDICTLTTYTITD
jgi:hypothetical protein